MKQIKAIILLFLAFSITSCSAQSFVVKTGQNYFSPRLYTTHSGVGTMEKSVTFDSSCVYSLGTNDDGDINKTYGWGVGLTSRHSIRIGWNCKSGYAIDLYAYLHYNGSRWMIPKDSSTNKQRADLIGKGWMLNVPITCRIHRALDGITFEAIQGPRKETLYIRFKNFPDGFGFYQWPYFGGNMSAPHPMKITLK